MEFTYADKNQWPEIKKIYLEAFPKAERKPYLSLRHSVKKGKALLIQPPKTISFWALPSSFLIRIW